VYVIEKKWQFVNGIITTGALNSLLRSLTSLDWLLNYVYSLLNLCLGGKRERV